MYKFSNFPHPCQLLLFSGFLSYFLLLLLIFKIMTLVLVVKNVPASTVDIRDVGLILGLGRSFGEGHDNHSSILTWKKFTDRGA